MQLHNKTVLIPGASRPIGRQIARRFFTEGANLVLPWFDWLESVQEMEKEFSNSPDRVLLQQCDLRDRADTHALCDFAFSHFGSLDFLINNIERGGMPVVHGSYDNEQNLNQWDLEFDTTVKAKWNLYQSAKNLLSCAPGGAVVNISSIAALVGRSGPASCFFNDGYSSANRGIRTLTETWARELAPTIRVNELMLGLIHTRHGENTRGWSALTQTEKEALISHTLLHRLGTPDEVANLVYFLAVEATYITGSVIRMDGGYLLGGDTVPPIPQGIL